MWRGKILNEREKAIAKIKGRPASADDVFEFVKRNPDIMDPDDFVDLVDGLLEKDPQNISAARLNKFLTRNARDAGEIPRSLLERRDRAADRAVDAKTWADFMDEAWRAPRACPEPKQLQKSLLWSVKWHDRMEPMCKNSINAIGNFAENLYFDSFQDRKENLFSIGAKGSGKTTVLNAFFNILPTRRIFTPAYESNAPFSGIRNHHIVGNFQEFRCHPKINKSTLLLWTERRPDLKIDVKHEDPTILRNGGPRCIFSTNYLKPCQGWGQEDIDALHDRAVHFVWTLQLPDHRRTLAARNTCKKCSIGFLARCSAKLGAAFVESTGGPETKEEPNAQLEMGAKAETSTKKEWNIPGNVAAEEESGAAEGSNIQVGESAKAGSNSQEEKDGKGGMGAKEVEMGAHEQDPGAMFDPFGDFPEDVDMCDFDGNFY